LPDGPELIAAFLEAETDTASRRNAFLMLFKEAEEVAFAFLAKHMDNVGKYGDGFALLVLELTRQVCRRDPTQKSRFVRVLFIMLGSASPAVSYEVAWTLVSLSSARTAIRAAAVTYINLLSGQTHNVNLIVHNLRIQLNATEEARKRQQGPLAGMFKKRLSDVAGSITRSLSDGMGDGPLSSDGFGDGRIVIGSPPRDAQSSTIERLLMGERPHFSDDAGDRKVSPDSPSWSSVLERLRQTLGPAADAGSH
jgi:hypothetical protein